MGKGGGGQTVGYWYAVGMHMVLCHSIDDVVLERIMVGDRVAYGLNSGEDPISSNGTIYIDQEDLFGGEAREGGIQGNIDLMFGGLSQTCNDYLVSRCGGGPAIDDPNQPPLAAGLTTDSQGLVLLPDKTPLAGYSLPPGTSTVGVSGIVPAFRNVLSVVLRQVWVAALNPYIKVWSFLVHRYPAVLGAGLGQINTDANPSAIIADVLTNTEWGLGFPSTQLDFNSFTAAANTLKNEGFGLSFTWSQQETADDFITHVLSTVDGYRYTDPATGKIGISLARDDYDVDTLQVFDESTIDSVQSFTRTDPSDIINQVTVTFIERVAWGEVTDDPGGDDDGDPTGNTILENVNRAITVHNGASIELVGTINPTSIDYPGIPNISLAARVAMRELATRSRGMATIKFIANRAASQLKGGDVFVLNWAPYNIVGMVLRVTEVDYGLLTDGRITVSAMEDIFSLPATTYIGGGASQWVEPIETAKPISNFQLFELPYYLVATELAADNDVPLSNLPSGYAFLGAVVARQQQQATSFSLWENSSGHYVQDQTSGFTPYCQLTQDIDDVLVSFTVALVDLTNFAPNSYALLENEWVQITGLAGGIIKVTRAIMDSVPVKHSAGATLWLAGSNTSMDTTTFLNGQSLGVRLQARTARDVIALNLVPINAITFTGRAQRPYAPGNIRVNGVYRPAMVHGPIATIAWSHRNRLTQTAGPIAQTASDITPEVGTTYTVTIKQRTDPAQAWTTVETTAGITTNTYAPIHPLGDTWTHIEIFSTVAGVVSYQTQIIEFQHAGFGVGFGNYFGDI